jgi:hypothetical protein
MSEETKMSEMVDRGAKAIDVEMSYYNTGEEPMIWLEDCRKASRVAMAAISEPTPAMIEAGKAPLQSISGFDVEKKLAAIWRAMHAEMMK